MSVTYTDWMSEFTEDERKEYVSMAARNFEDLTDTEIALLERWNNAKALHDAEVAEQKAIFDSQMALSRANAIQNQNNAFYILEELVEESEQRYKESVGGE